MALQLNMDRHLKERLVGAAVLVLVAVLFVPELLSGPPQPRVAAQVVAVSDVPTSTAASLRTYTVNLDHPASQVPLTDASALPSPQSPLPSAVQAQSAPAGREPASTPGAQPAAADDTAAAPARSEPKVEVLPAARPATVPADDSAEPARRETRADPRSEARTTTHPEAHTDARTHAPAVTAAARPANSFAPIGEKGGWSIQLGSFANKANAEKLARTLRSTGIRVYVSQGGGKHRVRAGPFADRASAERMAGRLRSQGQSVSIIAP
jgi:DedD protein